MLRQILRTIVGWFGFDGTAYSSPGSLKQTFVLKSFDDQRSASIAARQAGVAALVRGGGKEKWLLMQCPCGCGEQIALNLMQSHSPRWRVSAQSERRFTVHPSVDSTSCGAHFWLRDGKIIWAQ